MKNLIYLLIILSISCAQQTALTGGNKDTSPPEIISNKSVPSPGEINFSGKEIKLVFDENITYQKSSTSFLSNPPIGEHVLKTEKNILNIIPEKELLKNTTYSFIFTNSIADLNEKNKIGDLRFSFSTGSILDTIIARGLVKNSFDETMSANYMVMLKSISHDSTNYISLTNETGEFFFDHLKPGEYTLLAWEDLNENSQFDTLDEPYGFLLDPIKTQDSCCKDIIKTFTPIKPLEIEKMELNDYGNISIVFNQIVDTLNIKSIDSSFVKTVVLKTNEASFWPSDSNANYQLIIEAPFYKFKDTVVVRKSNSKNAERKLVYQKKSIKELFSSGSLELVFNQKIVAIDTSLLVLQTDSNSLKYNYEINQNVLSIQPEKLNGSFNLSIYPNGVSGLYNEKTDTSKVYFNIPSESNLGSLTLNINNSRCENYIMQILFQNNVIHEIYSSKKEYLQSLTKVLPGEYQIRIINDVDQNKKWSCGDIKKQTQPEEVIYLDKKITVKKNWEEYVQWNI